MALIKCEDCGKEISDKAPACPQCGAPQAAGQTATATAPPKPETPKDTVYHKKDTNGVEVTSTRFIVRSKTYPINGITSVQVVTVNKSRALPILLLIAGAIIAAIGNREPAAIAAGITIAIIAVVWMILMKDKWGVAIVTAAGEVQPLVVPHRKGTGKPYIQKVADAISKAIIHRG